MSTSEESTGAPPPPPPPREMGPEEDIDSSDSLLRALSQVDKLDELLVIAAEQNPGVEEDQPIIEAQSCAIVYQANFDTNFEDRNGFVTGIAKYIEEATIHAALNELLLEGEQHAITLYTWRCCSRGIPQPKSDDDPKRVALYEATVSVLSPEVKKLFNLIKFQKSAIERFCAEVKILCHPEKRKEFVSEAYLLTLGKFINMFAILDELKNIKSSIKNDFSTYKRAAQFLRLMTDMQSLQECQNLSLFLATQNKIRNNLKDSLVKIAFYEEVLCDVINICVEMFENRIYLLPQEKHMLVKVIGFSLDLIDNDKCHINIYKLDHKKKIKLEKIDKIFKAVEVVPLYGDMQISPFQYVKRSKHFDPSKWPLCINSPQSSTPPIDIVQLLPGMWHHHLKYLAELQECTNSAILSDITSTTTLSPQSQKEVEMSSERICNVALKGLRLLSDWVTTVSELYSWKLLNPTDHHQNHDCPPTAEEYERATRYNYTSEEKSALVQLVSLIKGLQLTLSKVEDIFSPSIRKDLYTKVQNFAQLSLREPLRKAVKNKKVVLRSILQAIREASGDFVETLKVAEQDPILKGEKAPPTYDKLYKIDQRQVGPSSTQLYLLRTMLESVISDKTCANRHLRKDIDPNCLPVMESFYRKTVFWGHLQNYGEILSKCCDLSQLWYREFYLEMTMGKRIQFPIAMSMPWILINHVLENPNMMEYALYPWDLYNDSCDCALSFFKKQFLYDELEAEVNLCFDQFVYKLSEQIFSHFKRLAATSLLDRGIRASKSSGSPPITPPRHYRYESLIKQRRVQILGHSIDLGKLIQQRISKDLLKSLEIAISKFQEGDLTGIVQLEGLLAVNRETHKLLRKVLHGLDDFDAIWREANYNVNVPHGRTTIHIFCEVNWDFLSNFCFNGATHRFVRSKGFTFSKAATEHREKNKAPGTIPPHHLWGSKQLNAAFSTFYGRYSGFVGEPHFRAMARILGYQGIAVVIHELLKVIQNLVQGPIHQFTRALTDVMPKKVPLKPVTDESSSGILEFYLQLLKDILQFPDVKMRLFQNFREVGNAILFCLLIEKGLSQEETWTLVQSAPFQNIYPVPVKGENEDEACTLKRAQSLEREYASLEVIRNVDRFGTIPQKNLTREAYILSKEKLCNGLSIFPEVLTQIKGFLEANPVWKGSLPENQVMNVDEGTEFYRVWSALQFRFCIPVGPNELSVEQLYGDSFNWGGITMIALLGQQNRFEAMDFSNRLQEAQRTDGGNGVVKGIHLRKMILRIRCFQHLNFQIFSLLKRYLEPESASASASIRCFLPPIHKTLLEEQKTQEEKLDLPGVTSKIGEGDQVIPISSFPETGEPVYEDVSSYFLTAENSENQSPDLEGRSGAVLVNLEGAHDSETKC